MRRGLFTNCRQGFDNFGVPKFATKMDNSGELDSYFSTDVFSQLMLAKTSTLVLMTTSVLLFVTLVAKSFSSRQSQVILPDRRDVLSHYFAVRRSSVAVALKSSM